MASILNLLSPIEVSISEGNLENISNEHQKLCQSFDDTNSISLFVSEYSETFPQTARFYSRLQQIDSSKCNFSPKQKICLTLFINKVIQNQKRTTDQHFKKDHAPYWPLPYCLQYSAAEQATYVIKKLTKENPSSDRQAIIQFPDDSEKAAISPNFIIPFTSIFNPPNNLHVKERIAQISQIDFQECGIPDQNNEALSLFIETAIHNQKRTEDIYFKKRTTKKTQDLACSVLYSAESKSTFILLKNRGYHILNTGGTYKKVTAAIQIPDDKTIPPTLVSQVVNRKELYYKDILDEAQLHKKFSGNKGIWPLIALAKYQQIKNDRPGDHKVSIFSKIALSGEKIAYKEVVLTIDQHLELAEHLITGLHCLHSNDYFHGDLFYKNFLFNILPDSKVIAGLIDFGFSFPTSKGPNPITSYIPEGFYGVIDPTAPELFGTPNFTGDLYKAEIWSLGFLLYTLFLQKRPSWGHILDTQWKNHHSAPVGQSVKDEIIEKVTNSIKPLQEKLLAKEKRSSEDDYLLLICDMFELDPKKRPDSSALTERIANIQVNRLADKVEADLNFVPCTLS